MPEFPEVNVQIRYLRERCVGWTIDRFGYRWPRHFKKQPREGREAILSAFFEGNTIEGVTQRGKHIILKTPRGLATCHLMLKGRWSVDADPFVCRYPHYLEPPEARSCTFWVEGGEGRLGLYDPENWAGLEIHPGVSDPAAVDVLADLGPEVAVFPETDPAFATPWSVEAFGARAARSGHPIKLFLLDQKRQSGLGNRYVAEALYEARVSPHRPARDLSAEELSRVVSASQAVLRRAIDADLDYDAIIQVYKRERDPLGNPVRSDEIGKRDSWWVPALQS